MQCVHCMATKPISLRIPEKVKRDLEQIARRFGTTLPAWIALRVAEGKQHSGILFYDLERFKSHQIGALAKALVTALNQTKVGWQISG
jgi:hypothetical protein